MAIVATINSGYLLYHIYNYLIFIYTLTFKIRLCWMGAMCVSEEVKLEREQYKKKCEARQREYKQELNHGVYAEKIRKYAKLFGHPVDE